jgi:hypothetical protein
MRETLISILIYTVTIASTVFFSWIYEKKANTKIKKIFFFIMIVTIPIVISTFRYKVGIDFDSYKEYYDIILRRYNSGEHMPPQFETGFIILNIISYYIFNNAQGAFFLMSLLFVCFSIGGIIKYKDKVSIPISTLIFMTFFYSAFFNGSRQLLAASIVFFSLSYLLNKEYIKYILFIILATLFHKTALMALPFYFLVPKNKEKIDYNDKKFNISIILFIILFPFLKGIMKYICDFFKFYSTYFEILGDKSIKFLLYIIPPLLVLMFFRKKIIDDDYKNQLWIRLMILQIPIQFMGYHIKYLDRLSLYVSIAQIIIMSNLCKIVDDKYKKIVKWFVIIWFIFYYIVVYIFLNGNGVYPYKFKIGL